MVRVRFEPLPPITILLKGTREGLEELKFSNRFPTGDSASPTVKGRGSVLVSIGISRSAIREIAGGSFTGFTVTAKIALALDRPSLTVSVMVALPLWLVAGRTVTVRWVPLPPKTMLAGGTSVGLDEALLSVRLAGGVFLSSFL